MALTAKFTADFNNFYDATKKAEDHLKSLGQTTTSSQRFFEGLHGSLQQFDRMLNSLGVNITSYVGAVGEIGAAVGKPTSELGLFTTAGLAATAAMAGWEFGRVIAGWLGTDEAIGKATASLLGWGDVAAETAGAKQDVINRALRAGAAANITYADAIKYNTEVAREHNLTIDTATRRIQGYEQQLEKVAKGGHWQQLTEDMQSNVFTQKEIATRYGISVQAVR